MKFLISIMNTLLGWGAAKPVHRGSAYTCDSTAILYRMKAGNPGDVNRTHPVSIEPCLIDDDTPPTAYGQAVVVDAAENAVRPIAAADQSDATSLMVWGFTVRPYPSQQTSGGMTSSFGSATPPTSGEIDVARKGYIMAKLNDSTQTPRKSDPVYVWCSADAGAQVQGGITTTFDAGDTVKLANAVFNGPADADGNVEIIVGDRMSL